MDVVLGTLVEKDKLPQVGHCTILSLLFLKLRAYTPGNVSSSQSIQLKTINTINTVPSKTFNQKIALKYGIRI